MRDRVLACGLARPGARSHGNHFDHGGAAIAARSPQSRSPIERKQKLEAEQIAAAESTYKLEQLIEDFIRKHDRDSRASTVYEVRRLCRRALPYVGAIPIKQIAKADILKMTNDLAETRRHRWRGNSTGGALSEASGTLKHLRTCFQWASMRI